MRSSGWLMLLLLLAVTGWAEPALDTGRLERAEHLLQQAGDDPATASARLKAARELVPAKASPSLDAAIRAPKQATIAKARREIASLRALTRLPSPTVAPGDAADSRERQALQRVLSRGEFSTLKDEPIRVSEWPWVKSLKTWWAAQKLKLAHWWSGVLWKIGEFLRGLFSRWHPRPTGASRGGPTLVVILYVLIIGGLLFLIGFVVSRILLARARLEADESIARLSRGEFEGARPGQPYVPPWEQALRDAEALWERGKTREAIRLVLHATLVLLDQRGVLRFDDTRANGEVLRELRRQGRSELTPPLRTVIRTFDRGWYGSLPIPADEFADVLATSRDLHARITGGA